MAQAKKLLTRRSFPGAIGNARGWRGCEAYVPKAVRLGANDRRRAAVLGVNGQGEGHIDAWNNKVGTDINAQPHWFLSTGRDRRCTRGSSR